MNNLSLINKTNKILIIGLGLLGGSYAEGLTDVGLEVGAIDINQQTIDYAINKGIIKHGKTTVDEEYVSEFDILIFALYPKQLIEWLKKYQSYIKKGAILTDVTGVKTWVVNELKTFIRNDIEYVLAHPMAGKEVSGVEYADKNMFKNANYIIIPNQFASENAIKVVEDIGKLLGFRNVAKLSEEEHDEMIGFLSQLTHCIAVSLMTCKETTELVE